MGSRWTPFVEDNRHTRYVFIRSNLVAFAKLGTQHLLHDMSGISD